jgi:shikimate kinase
MEPNGTRPIALIGLMGAGKSVVAAALGRRLGGPVADVDDMVEAAAGALVAEVFELEGEAGFRRRESAALEAALANRLAVLATGGGIVIAEKNRELLRQRCRVIWLEVTPLEAARRVRANAEARPLLRGSAIEERLEILLRERTPFYEMLAEHRVPTSGFTAGEVADAILSLPSGATPAGSR